MKRIHTLVLAIFAAVCIHGAPSDPAATNFTPQQCRGSHSLYPAATAPTEIPDSLTPVFINHVGRHGSRYPASAKALNRLREALGEKPLTTPGRELLALCNALEAATAGRWGALDSIGMAEECAIATRMYRTAPELFDGALVEAFSSYSPRSIMSMYAFTHQLTRLNNKLMVTTASGPQMSTLLRPFDTDAAYREYVDEGAWKETLERFRAADIPLEPIRRALGAKTDGLTDDELRQLALDEYSAVSCAAAAGVDADSSKFFNTAEYNRLWQAANMRHYLLYSASTVSTIPADMAAPLLVNLLNTLEEATQGRDGMPAAILRFGHAETLMPLLALMRLKGCYYMTNYFETVATHWQDFNIVPMAANLQLMLLKNRQGRLYLRVELNGTVVPLMPGSADLYTPWDKASEYLNRCIPIFYQE